MYIEGYINNRTVIIMSDYSKMYRILFDRRKTLLMDIVRLVRLFGVIPIVKCHRGMIIYGIRKIKYRYW